MPHALSATDLEALARTSDTDATSVLSDGQSRSPTVSRWVVDDSAAGAADGVADGAGSVCCGCSCCAAAEVHMGAADGQPTPSEEVPKA